MPSYELFFSSLIFVITFFIKMHTIFFYYSALHPHVAGLILARGGSRGIPLKNVTLLKDTPLLAWSLSAMRTFRSFDSLWVSTGVNTGNLSIFLLVT